jgi:hypothetical protein
VPNGRAHACGLSPCQDGAGVRAWALSTAFTGGRSKHQQLVIPRTYARARKTPPSTPLTPRAPLLATGKEGLILRVARACHRTALFCTLDRLWRNSILRKGIM